MNWEMIGALAEAAGAAAVVVSLLYLAKQVAISNRLARAEASRLPVFFSLSSSGRTWW